MDARCEGICAQKSTSAVSSIVTLNKHPSVTPACGQAEFISGSIKVNDSTSKDVEISAVGQSQHDVLFMRVITINC